MALENIPAASTTVDCSGTVHTIVWRNGGLEATDHPDAEADRALAALGGDPCRCIELLDAWQRAIVDPRALVLGPRGPRTAFAVPEPGASRVPAVATGPSGVTTYHTLGSGRRRGRTGVPAEPQEDPLEQLLTLGGSLPQRLVVTVADGLNARTDEPELRGRCHAALYGRVLVTMSRWLGELPRLELELIGPDTAPSLSRDGDGLHLGLRFDWLTTAWAAGLEMVGACFTLAAHPRPNGTWDLITVDELMVVNTCTLISS